MYNIIIKKSKEGNKLFLFTGYEDDNEFIVTRRQQQFNGAKSRKIVAVRKLGRGDFLFFRKVRK